jgi:hypothetical protein
MEHDVVAVACLLERHPLPPEQTAQLLQGLRQLSFSASFRETALAALSEERAGQLVSSLLGEGSDAAVTVVLQMVCNAAVQNQAAAHEIANRFRKPPIGPDNAVAAAALLHTLGVWSKQESAIDSVAQLANGLLPDLIAHFDYSAPGAALWLASVAAHSRKPFAELCELFHAHPETLALAMEKFSGLFAWQRESGWIADNLEAGLSSFATLFSDDSHEARVCAQQLVLQHNCLEVRESFFCFFSLTMTDGGAAGGRGGRAEQNGTGAAAAGQSGVSQRARSGRGNTSQGTAAARSGAVAL